MSPRTKLAAGVALAVAAALGLSEGRRHEPYTDPVGIRTVCDGITGPDVIEGKRYTDAECDALTEKHITHAWVQISWCIPVELKPYEQGAYTHLSYNIGAGAFCRSSIPRKLALGDFAAACATISQFYKAQGRDCRVRSNNCYGLVKRREFERAWCEGKVSP